MQIISSWFLNSLEELPREKKQGTQRRKPSSAERDVRQNRRSRVPQVSSRPFDYAFYSELTGLDDYANSLSSKIAKQG